jgi:hypothetical protein
LAVTFNPETGLVVDDGETVRNNIATEWKKAFKIDETTPELNTEPETPAGQLIDGIAALVIAKDNSILFLSNMFNPETAVGVFQDALGKIYFINRHIAQSTVVTCTCRGLQGTQIPADSIVQDVNGNQFSSNAAATIGKNGMVDVEFSCLNTGAIEVNANAVNKIITVIPGWDSVINNTAGIIGRDRETQAEFEQRRYQSVAKNSHGMAESVGGSVNDLDGVIACRIEQNRTDEIVYMYGVEIPPHSIYLSVYGGNSQEIGLTIHQKLSDGCGTAGNTSVEIIDQYDGSYHTYYYTVPVQQDVYLKVTVTPFTEYDIDAVKQAIIENFYGELQDTIRVKMGDTLYSARFYQPALNAGLTNLQKIDIALNNQNYSDYIDVPLNVMPVLSEENIVFSEGQL